MSDGDEQEVKRSKEESKDHRRSRSKDRKKDKENGRDKDKKDKERDRSRERNRSRDKKSKDRKDKDEKDNKEKDRDKKDKKDRDRKRKRSRSRRRSKSKSRSRSKPRKRSKSPFDPLKEELAQASRAEREKAKAEYTIFVSQIFPKVKEKDLFEFFSHCGTVEDIRLIRDSRTGKSKGLCYVEFKEKESVEKGLMLTGQVLGNFPINVQRVIMQSNAGAARPAYAVPSESIKLAVTNLANNLLEADLKPIFEAFGPVDTLEVPLDQHGRNTGIAFVVFTQGNDAKLAQGKLDGMDLLGKRMSVKEISKDMSQHALMGMAFNGGYGKDEGSLEDEENMKMNPEQRAAYVASLHARAGVNMASPCVLIKNMFDPATETEVDWHLELREEVEEEARKYGRVRHISVDKTHPEGQVWIKFANSSDASHCIKSLHSRWFASRQITAEFVPEANYYIKFPEAK